MQTSSEGMNTVTETDLLTRRDLLCRSGMGMASLGLAGLIGDAGAAAVTGDRGANPLAPRPHTSRARSSASSTCS